MPVGLVTNLLLVNKQIQREATRILYGDNVFVFVAIASSCRGSNVQPWRFVHNMMDIPPQYLRMIKECKLIVDVVMSPLLYKAVSDLLLNLVRHLSDGHSLKKLMIVVGDLWVRYDFSNRRQDPPPHLQTVLEPLGTVHGIQDVQIAGVEPELDAKVSKAMQGGSVACTRKRERYGTRIVKRKGKKRSEAYMLRRFHESRFDWTEKLQD